MVVLILGTLVSCSSGFLHLLGDCGASTVSDEGRHACLASQRFEFYAYMLTLLACLVGVGISRTRERFPSIALLALFVLPSAVLFGLAKYDAARWVAVDDAQSTR